MSNVNPRRSSSKGFKGFLNINLTDADQQDFDYWGKAKIEDIRVALTTLISAGYKIGLSWNDFAGMFQCSATCKDAESIYSGYCIVITHEDLLQALVVMMHLYEKDLVTEKLMLPDDGLSDPPETLF